MQIIWNRAMLALRKRHIAKAQETVDRECIAKMHPYVPVAKPWFANHGKLRRSVKNPEPGVIIYTARFARKDYYATVNHRHGGNPEARRLWFAYMKSKHRHEIGEAAAKAAKARYERR